MLIEIPLKYGVSTVIGYIKGKSAIAIARTYLGKRNNFTRHNFWGRGYFVSTIGRDEEDTSGNRKQRTSGWISWKCSKITNHHSRL
jgi:REP element-mobilizing transposase RayT